MGEPMTGINQLVYVPSAFFHPPTGTFGALSQEPNASNDGVSSIGTQVLLTTQASTPTPSLSGVPSQVLNSSLDSQYGPFFVNSRLALSEELVRQGEKHEQQIAKLGAQFANILVEQQKNFTECVKSLVSLVSPSSSSLSSPVGSPNKDGFIPQARQTAPVIVFVGVPGAGKTTILDALKNEHVIFPFGTKMLKIAREHFSAIGIDNRDDMKHKLSIKQQQEVGKLTAQKVVEKASKCFGSGKMILVDTHAVVQIEGPGVQVGGTVQVTDTTFVAGLPKHVLEIMRPQAGILIEADPELIVERIAADKMRLSRVPQTEKQIETTQAIITSYMVSLMGGVDWNFSVTRIRNIGPVALTIKKVSDVLNQYQKYPKLSLPNESNKVPTTTAS